MKLMCANLPYTIYNLHAHGNSVSVGIVNGIPFFSLCLTSVVNDNLLPTACAPLFHFFIRLFALSFSLAFYQTATCLAHKYFIPSLSFSLRVCMCALFVVFFFHLSAFIECSISMWNYFFPFISFLVPTTSTHCQSLAATYRFRIQPE